jgi:hypothetical protein
MPTESQKWLLGNYSVNTSVATLWLSNHHVITATYTHATTEELWKRCFLCGPWQGYIMRTRCYYVHLHRDPASRRRRQKRKSQIWDSKIWSRVPRDSDPRKTALARASSIYKRQTRLLVREGVPQNQDRNSQTVINIWSLAPDGARHQDLLTDWPSVAMWLWLWLRDSLEMAVITVGGWCEIAGSLRGREPDRRGTSTVGSRYQATQWRLTENTSPCVMVICKVQSRVV